MFKMITVFLFIHSVTPVLMFYIYDDNPTIGFVNLKHGVGSYLSASAYSPSSKKQISRLHNPRIQKYTYEHIVDSHFKLMKSPSHRTSIRDIEQEKRTSLRGSDQAVTPSLNELQKDTRLVTNPDNVILNQQQQIPQLKVQQHLQQIAPQQSQQMPQQQQMQLPQKRSQPLPQQQMPQQHQQGLNQHQQQIQPHKLPQTQKLQQQQIAPQQEIPQERVNGQSNIPRSERTSPSFIDDYAVDARRQQDNSRQLSINKRYSENPPNAVNIDYFSPVKQRQQPQERLFEGGPNYVQMNIHKTQVAQDPQKYIRMKKNRQLIPAPVQGTQNNPHKMPTYMILDKSLQKTRALTDHDSKVMAHVLDAMTQEVTDRRRRTDEHNNKKGTTNALDIYNKDNKRSPVSENMRKYIGKDMRSAKEKTSEATPIVTNLGTMGDHVETVEMADEPYALFYRMNPESVDQQEGFVFLRPIETNRGPRAPAKH